MASRPVITKTDALCILGLGTPSARAFVALVASTGVLYVSGYPSRAFREDGSMRPLSLIASGPDAVLGSHFLALPLAISLGVFLFT